MFFADDSLLFFKGSNDCAVAASNFLETYCYASGQRINKEKSLVFFSKGCPHAIKEGIMNILEINKEYLSDQYLGMPTSVGSSKQGTSK
jgi:hypothetical protein